MSWPKIKLPEEDDGVCNTHFTYLWEPQSPQTRFRISNNQMPEMHVWVILPDRQEILDMTTYYLKMNHDGSMPDSKWTAPDPPDYLWCRYNKLPPYVIYNPYPLAVDYVVQMVRKTWGRV